MIKPAVLLFLNFVLIHVAVGQQFVYENKVYNNNIKTVQCYNTQKEQSVPVITLGSGEQLMFSFDDLRGASEDYWYTIEHCTYDWKSSAISALNYLEGATEDRIVDYTYSSKTLQKYTHYQLTLPNEQVKPKLSGNYLLKVYAHGDQEKPVCSQRFYIVEQRVNIQTEIVPSNEVTLRFSNQKLNVTVNHTMPIQNPYNDVKLVLMQNANPLTSKLNIKPTFVKPGSLIYNELGSNDFSGSNEFRKFDFRSFRYKGIHVQDINLGQVNEIFLFQDVNGNAAKYTQVPDDNGAFFIRNQENRDNESESDYAQVRFEFKAGSLTGTGDIYVTGRFNNFRLDEQNKLQYDALKQTFTTSLLLKQGVYDYQYVWRDGTTGKSNSNKTEGSFFETENDYQAFLYYRKPGARWDELIGYQLTHNILTR